MTKTLIVLAALAASASSHAALSIDAVTQTVGQSFDSLAGSGTDNPFVNDGTLAGWSLFNVSGTSLSSYRSGTGSSNTGGVYSFGGEGSADRALGSVGSNSFSAGVFALALANHTGAALAGFDLAYDGEQWRIGNTDPQSLSFAYGFGDSYGSVIWSAPGGGFDFVSPLTGSAGAVDGNGAGRVSGLGGSIAADWAAGDTLWLRWADANDPGSDHGLAIDNVAFSVSAVPEPATTALLLAGLAAVGTVARRRRG